MSFSTPKTAREELTLRLVKIGFVALLVDFFWLNLTVPVALGWFVFLWLLPGNFQLASISKRMAFRQDDDKDPTVAHARIANPLYNPNDPNNSRGVFHLWWAIINVASIWFFYTSYLWSY